jgi:hypothetical protein
MTAKERYKRSQRAKRLRKRNASIRGKHWFDLKPIDLLFKKHRKK